MFDSKNPREQLLTLLRDEMERTRGTITEIRGQIEQTELIIKRELQRNTDIASELHVIQENIEKRCHAKTSAPNMTQLSNRATASPPCAVDEKFQAALGQFEAPDKNCSPKSSACRRVDSLPSMDDPSMGRGGRAGAAQSLNVIRIIQAQEEEKQRLARLLHDGPAQSLTNFILQAEICQRLFDRDPARAAEELSNLKANAGSTFQKVRDFIFDLRPMMLDDLGVISTLEKFSAAFKEKYDIETKFEASGMDTTGERSRFQTHREVILFRTIQDLLGHARDFAKAEHILINLITSSVRVKAEVVDDGRGFEVSYLNPDTEPPAEHRERIQGILTLKEKLELVGGSLSVQSGETDGTVVSLELPTQDEV